MDCQYPSVYTIYIYVCVADILLYIYLSKHIYMNGLSISFPDSSDMLRTSDTRLRYVHMQVFFRYEAAICTY